MLSKGLDLALRTDPPTHESIDEALPALLRGAAHEWFTEDPDLPPIALLIDAARRTLSDEASSVVWIGRRVWPHPHALVARDGAEGARRLLEHALFVDPSSRAERVWAIDTALRSRASSVVIADGSGLGMPETRRFQLASAATGGACLLARPERERRALSACRTRWRVVPEPSDTEEQTWTVELLRCKGMRPTTARSWSVRRDHATGTIAPWEARDVRLVGGLPDRRPAQARPRTG